MAMTAVAGDGEIMGTVTVRSAFEEEENELAFAAASNVVRSLTAGGEPGVITGSVAVVDEGANVVAGVPVGEEETACSGEAVCGVVGEVETVVDGVGVEDGLEETGEAAIDAAAAARTAMGTAPGAGATITPASGATKSSRNSQFRQCIRADHAHTPHIRMGNRMPIKITLTTPAVPLLPAVVPAPAGAEDVNESVMAITANDAMKHNTE